MYPNLYYVFEDWFDIKIGFLRFINSFGFFVAISFLVAAALLTHELRRKSKLGLLQPTEMKIRVGEPASAIDLLTNFILGFLLGYKIIALFFLGPAATQDPQAYIFSTTGSLPAGLIMGLLFAGLKYWDKKKQQLKNPEDRVIRYWPHDRVGELTIIALVVGLLGAKLFDIFENWSDFLKRPAEYIFSGGGLTFYGGLICAALAIFIYARKHKIAVRHLADSIAPSLMIAYAIGRIGCQVAGDGDWGIYNSAFALDSTNHVAPVSPSSFPDRVQQQADFFSNHYQNLGDVHHASFPKPGALSFLPNWFFAYNYPHNVNEAGVPIAGCTGKYCNQLPLPVFPTPLYEIIGCTLLFLILWSVRKRIRPAGGLFCLYLILNGMERFLIEKIRVNNRMDFFGLHPTQAEVISAGLVLAGAGLWVYLRNKYRATPEKL
ncbi:MAG TPA: prolipoprotein diacylglyceryl transferase family protein [Flavisolibacter sp.]|jgi:prolipoprotein diacylglyceryltransferase|nr:prolipoprotein diacylglyceryl transferase family protein [Flavisolibacter sp.]